MSNKRRGPTYSTQEVDHLLDALREHLPIGQYKIILIVKYITFNLQIHYPPTEEMLDTYFKFD